MNVIHKKFTFLIPVLLFAFVFYSGCSTGNYVETVDSKTLADEYDDIKFIYKFKLKGGKIFEDAEKTRKIKLDFKDFANPKIVYRYDFPKFDTSGGKFTEKFFEEYSLKNVQNATVLFKRSNTFGIIIGTVVLIGVIALIFIANGERNKRE